MTNELTAYVKLGNRMVGGWLTPIAISVIVELADLQKQLGIRGPVCEIGVHHGKLFILLHLLTEGIEKSVAWDLFEHQDQNIDSSGRGDKEVVQGNLKRHGCDLGRIKINTANSLNLTEENILSECETMPRIFSIDGGHTAEITYNDLSLARRSLCAGGIVVLDDFFNEAWPGVADGACKYLHSEDVFSPVAIAGNKFILTNTKAAAKKYIHGLDRPHPGFSRKKSVAFGNEVLIFAAEERSIRNILANTRAWNLICDKPLGRLIKQNVDRWI